MTDDHEGQGRGGGGAEGAHGGANGGGGGHGDPGDAVGSIAGGTGELLEGVAGALGEDDEAKEGLEAAGEVAGSVKKGVKAAEGLQKGVKGIGQGNVGDAASGLGGALGSAGAGVGALTGVIGGAFAEGSEERRALAEAASIAGTVGQAAKGLGDIVKGGADLLGGLLGERHDVHYHLEVEDSEAQWRVHHMHLFEALGEMSSASIEASVPESEHPEEAELLGKDIGLVIERGEERRSFRGIVRHCAVRLSNDRFVVHFDAAPALWLAAETLDSRIYQDITVPDLVEKVVRELVGDRQRSVRKELTETYPKHEYLVQHRESHWEFLKRICQEEGIFLYFDHDEEEREILVLGDSNDNRPHARPDHDAVIEYEQNENQAAGREVATAVSRHHRVSATDVAVRGYDWTNPGLNVHHERVERGEWNGPRLEHYHHDNAVRHHEYDEGGGSYRSHTADRYSRMHTERLDVRRSVFSIDTTVVTAMPGHIFELQGHDVHDGRYLIVSASSRGEAGSHGGGNGNAGGHGGGFGNTLECIPANVPYRPPEPVRRSMPGPETATVVGPPGEEIHTDKHGRIKVQFHWDRQGQMDEHSSAWIRVNYGWAGPGWGQIFIPRIGMEVIVAFLGGDPDRPIAMGALYNGQNPPPYPLPDDKTKSTIKTSSSLGGEGYNELRFEDKKGEEEVWIHAEKDFNEVVEHDHTTRVKNCQTNTVDVDQTETIGNDQTLKVKNNREKTVDVDEENTITGNRTTTVGPRGGDDKLYVKNDRYTEVNGPHDHLWVTEGDKKTVLTQGKWDIETKNRFHVAQKQNTIMFLDDRIYGVTPGTISWIAGDGQTNVFWSADGMFRVNAADKIELHAMGTHINAEAATEVKVKGPTLVRLQSDTEIHLVVGDSQVSLTPDKVEIRGKQVVISASAGNTEIDATGIVKLKG